MKLNIARLLLLTSVLALRAQAQQEAASAPVETNQRLFAVEFKVGPKWVSSKQPQEQEFFREHSQNLRKLREEGSLVLGARYADKGLIVLAAESETAIRALVEQDLAVRHGTFVYEVHEFNVFYGGSVQPVRRQR